MIPKRICLVFIPQVCNHPRVIFSGYKTGKAKIVGNAIDRQEAVILHIVCQDCFFNDSRFRCAIQQFRTVERDMCVIPLNQTAAIIVILVNVDHILRGIGNRDLGVLCAASYPEHVQRI